MENPYQTPGREKPLPSDTAGKLPMQPSRGLVGHVRVVCILMFVQGGLELLMAAYLIVFGVIYPVLMQSMMSEGIQRQSGSSPPATMLWLAGGTMIVLGVATLAVAATRIYAGYRNFRFRSRTTGIVALALGLATMMTCYCAPTAMALAVYGLIVYVNPQVSLAFQFGEQGHSSDDILASFPAS